MDESVDVREGIEERTGYQREVYGLVDSAAVVDDGLEVAILEEGVTEVKGSVREIEGVATDGEAHGSEITEEGIEVGVPRGSGRAGDGE